MFSFLLLSCHPDNLSSYFVFWPPEFSLPLKHLQEVSKDWNLLTDFCTVNPADVVLDTGCYVKFWFLEDLQKPHYFHVLQYSFNRSLKILCPEYLFTFFSILTLQFKGSIQSSNNKKPNSSDLPRKNRYYKSLSWGQHKTLTLINILIMIFPNVKVSSTYSY